MNLYRAAFDRQLMQHEGFRQFPYVDTVGKITIGYGHNLTDRGLTPEQCLAILRDDIHVAVMDLLAAFPWVEQLDPTRQAVLVDMSFNLGIDKLKGFKRTLAAIRDGHFQDASVFMLQSVWAKQVGQRAITLATMMATGTNPFIERDR